VNGDCELQDQADAVGLRDVRYDVVADHLGQATDQPNPYLIPACSRFIRAWDEVQGKLALIMNGRGSNSNRPRAGLADSQYARRGSRWCFQSALRAGRGHFAFRPQYKNMCQPDCLL
jgi:hypothetical protein